MRRITYLIAVTILIFLWNDKANCSNQNVILKLDHSLDWFIVNDSSYEWDILQTSTLENNEFEFIESPIIINSDECFFPEGISPNNDGLNDKLDLSSCDVVKLEIFNRNGTLVYSKENYSDEWFGQTNKGDNLPVGTYFYTVIYDGGSKKRSAWIYISR